MPHELLKRAAADGLPFAWIAVTMQHGRWAASAGNQGATAGDVEELRIFARIAHALGAPDVLADLVPRPPVACEPSAILADLLFRSNLTLCENMISGMVAIAAMEKMGVVHHFSSTCSNRPSIQDDGPLQLISAAIVAVSQKIKRTPALFIGRRPW